MAPLIKIIQYDSYSFLALLSEALGDVCNNTGYVLFSHVPIFQ